MSMCVWCECECECECECVSVSVCVCVCVCECECVCVCECECECECVCMHACISIHLCIIIRDLRGGVCSVAHSVLCVVGTLNSGNVCTHFPCGDCMCMHYFAFSVCMYVDHQ